MGILKRNGKKFVLCLLAVMLTGGIAACGNEGGIDEIPGLTNPSENSTDITKPVEISGVPDGYIDNVYVFQENGITSNIDVIKFADWEEREFDEICTDPTCKHELYDAERNPDPTCTAVFPVLSFGYYAGVGVDFSILGNEKRLIFKKVSAQNNAIDDSGNDIIQNKYLTIVYECEADGSNRKKIAMFDGSFLPGRWQLHQNKLYGAVVVRSVNGPSIITEETDEYGIPINKDLYNKYTEQFGVLDLESMRFTSYTELEFESINSFNIAVTDKYVYGLVEDDEKNRIIYCADKETEECVELYKGKEYVFLGGAFGSTVMFGTHDTKGIYHYYLYDENTKQHMEILNSTSGGGGVCVVGDMYGICTGKDRDSENNYKSYYEFYDESGKKVEEKQYSENIELLYQVGDRVLYNFIPDENTTKSFGIYTVDVNDVLNIEEKGKLLIRY